LLNVQAQKPKVDNFAQGCILTSLKDCNTATLVEIWNIQSSVWPRSLPTMFAIRT
jgi:hypothetical protein